MKIQMVELVGDFAEDKDAAAQMREERLRPELADGSGLVELDFRGISIATQSFIHALISDILRSFGEDVLDRIEFKNCNDGVKGIISTVVQYSLDSVNEDASI